jgi:hypothetical protein
MSDDKKAPEKFPQKMVLPDGTVFTAYGITTTKAPPPITPLSGRGVSPAPKPAPTTHKPAVPVDWAFWPASRRVKRDEAIALSLGLDPHSLYSSTDGHINPEFCPDNATAILFLKRLNLLAASDSRTNILLSEFAAWAVSISLSPIPPEFEAIVSATKSNEARARAVDKVSDAMMARNKPVETVYIVQGVAPHVPAAPTATKTDGNGAPAKVGAGDTVAENEEAEQDSRESTSHISTHCVPVPKRTNILDAVIQLAKSRAVKATDWQSVWASLVQIAETKERPAPLLGFSDDEGVKYQDYSEVKFLSKKNFKQRWNRANPAR